VDRMVWYPRSSALLAPFAFIGAFAAEFGGSFEATSPAHGSPACAPPALQYVISRPPGSRAMRRAVRLALQRFRAAEKEVRMAGIADRPAAGASSQFDERAALRERHIRIDAGIVDIGLGLDHPDRQQPLSAPINSAERALDAPMEDEARLSSASRAVHPGIGREFCDPEAVDLPEHCAVTEATAQLPGDLARSDALRPSGFQMGDALIRPGRWGALARSPPEFGQPIHVRFPQCMGTINHVTYLIVNYQM